MTTDDRVEQELVLVCDEFSEEIARMRAQAFDPARHLSERAMAVDRFALAQAKFDAACRLLADYKNTRLEKNRG